MSLPEINNLHMLIKSGLSRERIAEQFKIEGWQVHLLDDAEGEARFRIDYADLEFVRVSPTEFLLNGSVDTPETNLWKTIALLERAGVSKSQMSCDEVRIN